MLQNATWAFFLRVTGAGLLFVFNWLVVQYLGVRGSGVFFLAFTILTIFSTIFLFGVDQYNLRSIAASREDAESKKFFLRNGQFVFWSSLIGGLALLVLSHPLSSLFKSPDLAKVLMILALTMPFLTLTTFFGGAMQAKRRVGRSVFILTNSYYLISIILFMVLRAFTGVDLTNLSYTFLAALIISFAINLLLTYKSYSLRRANELLAVKVGETFGQIQKGSRHLFLVSAIYLGLGWIDILLVGFFQSDDDVSIYSIASKIAKLLTFILFAINIILAPAVSRYFSEKNLTKLNREVQKATILSILFCLPLMILLLVFPSLILDIFGKEYEQGANVLRLLAIGQAVNAFTGAVVITMTMTKLEKKLNMLSASVLGFQFILGIILTPIFGMEGTAFSTFAGMTAINLLGAYYLHRYHSINVFPSKKLLGELLGHAKSSDS